MNTLSTRGAWCGARFLGTSRQEVRNRLSQLADLGFNLLLPNLKDGAGRVCWRSEALPEATHEAYSDFELPLVLVEECERIGIRLHAWFIDFYEGEQGAAFRSHPEWAMRNAHGNTTAEETLRGKRFGSVWMCPARRPGYTDRWLIPLYVEFAKRYSFESIHHDYVRYPGDLAPDQYCFCDWCLNEIPRWATYESCSYPNERFEHELYDRPYLEAHWEPSPKVLPEGWNKWARSERARFLLEGGFFGGGRRDLDYFFYTFRVEAIRRFVRECAEAVRAVAPNMKFSGAFFKNPIHSGRFIGQDWRHFPPHVDVCVPMDYRDHFPGTFDQYLALLEETIAKQRVWAQAYEELWIGFAINFLFKEEPDGPYPEQKVKEVVRTIARSQSDGIVVFCAEQIEEFGMANAIRRAFADTL